MQTHDIRSLQLNQYLRAFGAVLLGSLCAFQVSAQSVTVGPNGFDRFMALTTGANTQTIGFGPTGTPIVTDTFSTGSKLGNMGAFADSTPGSKGLEVRGSGLLPVGAAGRTTPFSMVAKVPPASLTKALKAASVLAGGWPGVVLFAGLAVADWLNSAELVIDPVTGEFSKKQTTSGVVCQAPATCYNYATGYSDMGPKVYKNGAFVYFASPQLACNNLIGLTSSMFSYKTITAVNSCSAGGGSYKLSTGVDVTIGMSSKVVPPFDTTTTTWIPYTEQQAMEALQGTLPAAQVLSDLYNKNVNIDVENVIGKFQLTPTEQSATKTVTGPQVVTETPAQNGQPASTKTVQTDYNCVFVMRDVSCDEKKTTTDTRIVTDPVTGLPVEEATVTTETKEAEKPAEVKDPCIDHPKRNGCREDEFDTPEGEIPKSTVNVQFQAEDLGFGGGSCPSNKTMVLAGGQTITLVDWADNCSKITTYAKPMILAMALFAAMMIIFGGGGRVET